MSMMMSGWWLTAGDWFIRPLLLLVVLPTFLFLKFSKTKSPLKLGIILGSLHFVPALLISLYYMKLPLSVELGGFGILLILAIYDFPISFLSIPSMMILFPNRIGLILIIILGALQYFFLGILIGRWYRKRHKALSLPNKEVV